MGALLNTDVVCCWSWVEYHHYYDCRAVTVFIFKDYWSTVMTHSFLALWRRWHSPLSLCPGWKHLLPSSVLQQFSGPASGLTPASLVGVWRRWNGEEKWLLLFFIAVVSYIWVSLLDPYIVLGPETTGNTIDWDQRFDSGQHVWQWRRSSSTSQRQKTAVF